MQSPHCRRCIPVCQSEGQSRNSGGAASPQEGRESNPEDATPPTTSACTVSVSRHAATIIRATVRARKSNTSRAICAVGSAALRNPLLAARFRTGQMAGEVFPLQTDRRAVPPVAGSSTPAVPTKALREMEAPSLPLHGQSAAPHVNPANRQAAEACRSVKEEGPSFRRSGAALRSARPSVSRTAGPPQCAPAGVKTKAWQVFNGSQGTHTLPQR